jgi:hypothetical protein
LDPDLHAGEKPAALAFSSCPLLDMFVQLPPSAKIEVPNAEIRSM